MDGEAGFSGKGLFSTAGQGRAFRRYRKKPGAIDRFAELLSEHWDEDDLAAGRSQHLDPGGNVAATARRMGVKPTAGNAMLQRIRRGLGPQAI